jgi:hypothetical protein
MAFRVLGIVIVRTIFAYFNCVVCCNNYFYVENTVMSAAFSMTEIGLIACEECYGGFVVTDHGLRGLGVV